MLIFQVEECDEKLPKIVRFRYYSTLDGALKSFGEEKLRIEGWFSACLSVFVGDKLQARVYEIHVDAC